MRNKRKRKRRSKPRFSMELPPKSERTADLIDSATVGILGDGATQGFIEAMFTTSPLTTLASEFSREAVKIGVVKNLSETNIPECNDAYYTCGASVISVARMLWKDTARVIKHSDERVNTILSWHCHGREVMTVPEFQEGMMRYRGIKISDAQAFTNLLSDHEFQKSLREVSLEEYQSACGKLMLDVIGTTKSLWSEAAAWSLTEHGQDMSMKMVARITKLANRVAFVDDPVKEMDSKELADYAHSQIASWFGDGMPNIYGENRKWEGLSRK